MPDSPHVAPSTVSLQEALELSGEILRNLEMNELSLQNVALKTARLARLLNEFEVQQILQLEAGGYPLLGGSFSQEHWRLAGIAGRHYEHEGKQVGFRESISELEETLRNSEAALAAAQDRDVSISSANPHQSVFAPPGNFIERGNIRHSIATASNRLASRRALIYEYVVRRHYELKFSGIADDVFARTRLRVDAAIGDRIPDAVKRLTAAYDNLRSENPEDWSNAVHSCRRIIEDLADAVFPPTNEVRTVMAQGKPITVKLGKQNYLNRILAFVEKNNRSERFSDLVGSHISFLIDRLESVAKAAQKGTHASVGKEEADRYVIYTYLLVGDVLSLDENESPI